MTSTKGCAAALLLLCFVVSTYGRLPKVAINCGSASSKTVNGVTFQGDAYFVGGTASDNGRGFYGSQRKGAEFEYIIADLVPLTKYVLQFHFAELDGNSLHERVFDVLSENNILLENLDIAALQSNSTAPAILAGVTSTDTNGIITLKFKGIVGEAQVCGIEVFLRSEVTSSFVQEEGLGHKKRAISTISKYIVFGYKPSDWYYDHEPYAWRRWASTESIGYPEIGGVGYLKGEDYYGYGVTWFWATSALVAPPGTYKMQCRWKFEPNAQFSENFNWWSSYYGSAGYTVPFWAPPYFGQGWIVFQHPSPITLTASENRTIILLERTPPTSYKRGISVDACWLERCTNSSCLSINECATYKSPCNIPDVCADTDTGYTCTPLPATVPITVTTNPFLHNASVPATNVMLADVCGEYYPLGNTYKINGTGSNITLSIYSGTTTRISVYTGHQPPLCNVALPYTYTSVLGEFTTVHVTGVSSPYLLSVNMQIIAPPTISTLSYTFSNFVASSPSGTVVLSWAAPPTGNLATSQILGYTILKNTNQNYYPNETSLVLSDLAKNTVYKFTLFIRTADFGQVQQVFVITPKSPTTPPSTPVLVDNGHTATSISLLWSVADRGGASPSQVTYTLQTSSDCVTYNTVLANTQTFYSTSYNRADFNFCARVIASTPNGQSEHSNVIFHPQLAVPAAVTDLEARVSIFEEYYTPTLIVTFTPPATFGGGLFLRYDIKHSFDMITWNWAASISESGEPAEVLDFAWLTEEDICYISIAAVTDVGEGTEIVKEVTIVP